MHCQKVHICNTSTITIFLNVLIIYTAEHFKLMELRQNSVLLPDVFMQKSEEKSIAKIHGEILKELKLL